MHYLNNIITSLLAIFLFFNSPNLNAVEIVLVPVGSTWNFLDNGSDQGTFWSDALYDDSSWSSGPAQLGYGDSDEATVVSFGPDSGNKFITTYFRQSFNVSDLSGILNLKLRLLRDDGAVVYLNGVEIDRSNMPSSSIDYLTVASSTASGTEEDTFYESFVDPGDLII